MRQKLAVAIAVVSLAVGVTAQDARDSVEDIYVVRSVRLSRVTPTAFCAAKRVGFDSQNDDQYSFKAVATRAADGTITNAAGPEAGRAHACFGPTSDPSILNFYAEGSLGTVTFTGRGQCRLLRADVPEPGINRATCFLELANLPAFYIGGLLTSNTILSRQLNGETSDPRGYVQASIATIRLWRKR